MANRTGAARTNHCRPPLPVGTRVVVGGMAEGEVVAVRRPRRAKRYIVAVGGERLRACYRGDLEPVG